MTALDRTGFMENGKQIVLRDRWAKVLDEDRAGLLVAAVAAVANRLRLGTVWCWCRCRGILGVSHCWSR